MKIWRRRQQPREVALTTLAEALDVVAAADTDVAVTEKALRMIGEHYADAFDLSPGTVALAVGDGSLALVSGASGRVGRISTYSVAAEQPALPWQPAQLRWLTGRPPAGCQLIVFVARDLDGTRVKAVLDDLREHRDEELGPVTVFVAHSHPVSVDAIREAYDDVELITDTELTETLKGRK